jgi:hypothetical protein
MKRFVENLDQNLIVACVCFGLIFSYWFFIPATAVGEKSVADEIISLDVTDRPLGEVLESISDATGCQFKIDASWEDYPITASFTDEPLYRVLKRIFLQLNSAVIYGSDRTIKIIIYDENMSSGKAAGYSVAIKPAEEPVALLAPDNEATAPQPEVEAAEESSIRENDEQSPEETGEPVVEENQSDTENSDAKEEASAEQEAEDGTAALEPEQQADTPEQEDNQSQETQSATDSSENSENVQSSEGSNEN